MYCCKDIINHRYCCKDIIFQSVNGSILQSKKERKKERKKTFAWYKKKTTSLERRQFYKFYLVRSQLIDLPNHFLLRDRSLLTDQEKKKKKKKKKKTCRTPSLPLFSLHSNRAYCTFILLTYQRYGNILSLSYSNSECTMTSIYMY